MAYTTINKGSDYFNTKLYTGNGTTNAITGVGFQPDLLWIKARSSAYNHNLYDAVRGLSAGAIISNTTDAEDSVQRIATLDADGFTTSSTNYTYTNASGTTYVAWNWLANGAGSSNTDGSITSTVSASTTSGFSIVTYTGNGTGGATVGHGLGVAPACVIVKNRTSGTYDWLVYHKALGATKYMSLNTTDASTTSAIGWNDTEPSSSVVTLGTANAVNTNSSDYVAYCLAEKKGFSKFGSYTGNGSSTDGAFVYTGFKPAFVMVKNTTTSGYSWPITDNKRETFNDGANSVIWANRDYAEDTNAYDMNFLSNGFKINTASNNFNQSGATYIYMAFAENPLVSSTGTPVTAR